MCVSLGFLGHPSTFVHMVQDSHENGASDEGGQELARSLAARNSGWGALPASDKAGETSAALVAGGAAGCRGSRCHPRAVGVLRIQLVQGPPQGPARKGTLLTFGRSVCSSGPSGQHRVASGFGAASSWSDGSHGAPREKKLRTGVPSHVPQERPRVKQRELCRLLAHAKLQNPARR